MKKYFFAFLCVSALAVWGILSFKTSAQNEVKQAEVNNLVSPNLVISQFQPAGGTANDEFVELHNNGATAVDLNGYRLVYRSASGTNDVLFVEWTTSTIVPAGGYYLIASTAYDGTVTPNITYNPTTCTCSMSATSGGLAIRQGAVNTGLVIDSVGYGTATNIFVETATTTAPAANDSKVRNSNGCADTDNNSNDFSGLTPSAPRNAASATNTCSGGGTTLFASISANPTTVTPGGTTTFSVTVLPATTPPSTGITVTGNLSNIGGSATQNFFDDGTNGDTTAGDNIFSYSATLPLTIVGGTYNISATATDAEARTANTNVNITVNAPQGSDDPLLLGNPSNATTDVANENNYLMIKPQYSLSYNRSKATPNWVAWRLDSSWIGSAPRQDDYRPDPDLPSGWYRVTDNDYSGSGYTRGHMCPSGDRTNTIPNNSATFLMTNFVPQIAENNSGSWEDFETYCRSLANTGNEIYIYSGGIGNIGTIAGGRIVIPQYTWKVVMIIPNGTDDLSRVNKQTRTIGLVVPNFLPLASNAPWRQFRVSVDTIENLTGYNFFTNVPKNTQEIIEKRRDRQ
ncbi:MAG TPA: DNA/RNA non-specific endonuclease [Pyrinomonadaceae bacterium]|nr:DNA/RNA non-specific endonuclease [Pyrinomonadaceae bacterium]